MREGPAGSNRNRFTWEWSACPLSNWKRIKTLWMRGSAVCMLRDKSLSLSARVALSGFGRSALNRQAQINWTTNLGILVLLCFFLPQVHGLAQTPDSAILHGRVADSDDRVLRDAQVTVSNQTTGLIRSAVTDAAGNFTFAGLPTGGAYSMTVAKEQFASTSLSSIQLIPGSLADLHVVLRVAGENSSVTVVGAAGDVRIDQPQLGIFLSRQTIEQVPLLTRRITFLPLLNAANRPAINQGDVFMNQNLFNTNGTGRRQAWFEVDGVNAVDMWGRQTIFSNIPLMAVEGMTVLTNAYSAEYGAGMGSVNNIVTRSGGDEFHGELLELWRPAGTEAALAGFNSVNATNGNEITSDRLGQTAASVSGPVFRKTHFFLAGEWNREAKASPITSPLAPNSFVGHYRGWLGFLRLDNQINAANNVFLRPSFDQFTDTNPNGIVGGSSLPSVDRIFHRRTYSVGFGETAVLSPHLLNDLRAQFQLASPITQFDPLINSTQFSVPITSLCGSLACGTFTMGTSQSALLMNRQYEVTDTFSRLRGRQQTSIGGSVLATHNGGNSKEFGGPLFLGKFTYNPCPGTPAYCESSAYLGNIGNVANYQQSYGRANYTVDDQIWSLFLQETYRVNKQLVLSGGLRYERQMLTDAKFDFAPRVGFVWNVLGAGSIVFRGGFGIYDSQVVDNSFANYALGEPGGVFTYTATPGQVGFPASVAAAPLPSFPTGAIVPIRSLYVRPGQPGFLNAHFPTSVLNAYPNRLMNPYAEQYTASVEARLKEHWVLSLDYVGTHALRVVRPLDVDPPAPFVRTVTGTTTVSLSKDYVPIPGTGNVRTAQQANCSRPYWAWWYSKNNLVCDPTSKQGTPSSVATPPYSVMQTDVNNGYLHYDALDVNLAHAFNHGFSMLASYTWSHTLDNVDPDTTGQNPNDPNLTGIQEYGPALYDQRHRAVLSGVWITPFRISVGGVATLGSALPFNYVTGTVNSGDTGASTDRPVINGTVIGRNAGRGRPIYSVDPFISRSFSFAHERAHIELRAEAFNVLNHRNFIGYSGTYGNGVTQPTGFGAPLPGVTSQLTARSMQFSTSIRF